MRFFYVLPSQQDYELNQNKIFFVSQIVLQHETLNDMICYPEKY